MPLPRIMVAPNGARLTKADHPALPLTLEELLACAHSCRAAGADGIHAHIRDNDGQHLLDAGKYRELVQAFAQELPGFAVQITSEAAGRYDPDHQIQVVLQSEATMASVSVREICGAEANGVRRFLDAAKEKGIAIQHILYDHQDCLLLESVLDTEELKDPALQLIFVLGRYSGNRQADLTELSPFLDWLAAKNIHPDWMVCAFGLAETECLRVAVRYGGKCRVGFENSLYLRGGSLAKDNAAKVADLVAVLAQDQGRAMAS